MNKRGALIAYAVTIVSAVSYLSGNLIIGGYYGYYYSFYDSYYYLLRNILYSVGIGGMVIGPYFGVAALIVRKSESVWVRVNTLINGHISIPFISGFALGWGGLFAAPAFGSSSFPGEIIVPYTVFVILATVITYMGNRDTSPITANQTHNP